MISGVFIAGTGTDVGKTIATAAVLRWLRTRSIAAMAMKPVQTGALVCDDGRIEAPDIGVVLQAAGATTDDETRAHLSPYLFRPACSPHLAARLAGEKISIDRILASAAWLGARHQWLVVEGAGGLAVPLNEDQTMLDLVEALALPVLLVGHSGLGTVNHVLLSLEALRQRGCKVVGVVLNDVQPVREDEAFLHDDNVGAIACFGRVQHVIRIPYLGKPPDLTALDASLGIFDFLQEQQA